MFLRADFVTGRRRQGLQGLGTQEARRIIQRRTIAIAFERVKAGLHHETRQQNAGHLLKLDEKERNQETEGTRSPWRNRDLCWVRAPAPSIAPSSGSSPVKKPPDGISTTGTCMDSPVFVNHGEHNGCRGLGGVSDVRWCGDGIQMKDSGYREQPCEPCQKGRLRGRATGPWTCDLGLNAPPYLLTQSQVLKEG